MALTHVIRADELSVQHTQTAMDLRGAGRADAQVRPCTMILAPDRSKLSKAARRADGRGVHGERLLAGSHFELHRAVGLDSG